MKMFNKLFTSLFCSALLIIFIGNISIEAKAQKQGSEDNININGSFEDVFGDIPAEEQNQIRLESQEYMKSIDSFTLDSISLLNASELKKYNLLPLELQSVDSSYTVYVPYYKQQKTYTCGPAATLQALYTAGCYNDIAGSTAAAKEATLEKETKTTTSGAWINDIVPVINKYTQRTRKWTILEITDSNKSTMQYFTRSNHAYNNAVIYLVRTGHLSYYNGHFTNHYITGSGIYYDTKDVTDYANIRIRLTDPHYNSSYGGSRIQSFNNVHTACKEYTKLRGPASFLY